MNEKTMIITSIAHFLKNTDKITYDIIDMYNSWSLTENIIISNDNVIFAYKTLEQLIEEVMKVRKELERAEQ